MVALEKSGSDGDDWKRVGMEITQHFHVWKLLQVASFLFSLSLEFGWSVEPQVAEFH